MTILVHTEKPARDRVIRVKTVPSVPEIDYLLSEQGTDLEGVDWIIEQTREARAGRSPKNVQSETFVVEFGEDGVRFRYFEPPGAAPAPVPIYGDVTVSVEDFESCAKQYRAAVTRYRGQTNGIG